MAREVKVNIENYGLPDNTDNLHETVNVKLKDFKSLIEGIKPKSKALKTLEGFIKRKAG